jgi:hypothetical protein
MMHFGSSFNRKFLILTLCFSSIDLTHALGTLTTLLYTQLVNPTDNEYVCKVAKTVAEATQLIESGFEYVTTLEDCQLYKKRK